ncbi:GDP-D-glucose phosphorylase 1-like [Amphibalanus amphitrite]|uniref:GDP-D-glucose phosphorylase 1-like n=1 Tax=Amphibalanus amphitrite TaxID=1232801 RepID=UPI001C90589F|nr:GDP-D-glucose phosphorylase 1-like [Amphibalanus amphitrite]
MEGNCVDANSMPGDPATFSYSGNDFVSEVKSLKDFPDAGQSEFDALLEVKWREAMNKGLFRFAYNPGMPQRRLSGKFGFFLEVNGERHSTRRPPPAFTGTRHPFDPSRFHFGRAPVAERLFRLSAPGDQQDGPKIQQNGPTDQQNGPTDRQNGPTDRQNGPADHCAPADVGDDWVMINVSPIGRSHVLLLPRLSQLRPQLLDPRGLQMMLHCLLLSRDSGLRGMFNSLGALASVNHYHLHLYRLPRTLYVETADVRKVVDEIYEFTDYPARAFVFEVSPTNLNSIASRVVSLTELILDRGLAFNLVATRGHPCSSRPTRPDLYTALRVMVWPRQPEFPQLPREHFQLASCEMMGHIAVTSAEALDVLTESSIVESLRSVTEAAFDQVRSLVVAEALPKTSGESTDS